MQLIKARDYDDMSARAAALIAAQVIFKRDSRLGLATGSTVLGVYKKLAETGFDFSHISTYNLDEYDGLDETDKNSYRHYMNTNFFRRVNIKPGNTHFPDAQKGKEYDTLIELAGGLDLQLLGLGHNGHIGFNEPCGEFIPLTHTVTLDESTRKANSRFFRDMDAVPKTATTMGIRTIMCARKIILCVSGKEKSEILRRVLYGPILPAVPGSVLQLHPDFTVVADADALGD